MKTIRLIIAGLVMTMGFSSCSSLFYDAKVDVLNSIQKGMSRQEVTNWELQSIAASTGI